MQLMVLLYVNSTVIFVLKFRDRWMLILLLYSVLHYIRRTTERGLGFCVAFTGYRGLKHLAHVTEVLGTSYVSGKWENANLSTCQSLPSRGNPTCESHVVKRAVR